MHAQRAVQRQGMTHGALRAVRRHDVDFTVNVTDIAQTFFESGQSFGLDAIVIRKQDDHARILAKKPKTDKGGEIGSRSPSCFQRRG